MKPLVNSTILNTFPVLESNRLIFRSLNPKDAQALLEIRKNDAVSKYMDSEIPKTIEDIETRIKNIHSSFKKKEGITWAIIEKTSGKLIGDIAIWQIDYKNSRGTIGYVLSPEFWGKGFMKESMNIIIQFAFNVLNLHSIKANVNPKNENSKALLLKQNFKLEAIFRENYYYDGKFLNSEIYCLLQSDIT